MLTTHLLSYIDRFNSFRVKNKSWSKSDSVTHVHQRDATRFSVTVTAAIGHSI